MNEINTSSEFERFFNFTRNIINAVRTAEFIEEQEKVTLKLSTKIQSYTDLQTTINGEVSRLQASGEEVDP